MKKIISNNIKDLFSKLIDLFSKDNKSSYCLFIELDLNDISSALDYIKDFILTSTHSYLPKSLKIREEFLNLLNSTLHNKGPFKISNSIKDNKLINIMFSKDNYLQGFFVKEAAEKLSQKIKEHNLESRYIELNVQKEFPEEKCLRHIFLQTRKDTLYYSLIFRSLAFKFFSIDLFLSLSLILEMKLDISKIKILVFANDFHYE